MKQNITILGSTGSIGTNTLDVLSRHLDRYQVFALTASVQVEAILAQCVKFKPRYAVMAQENA
ncbi:MAG: 1-deoxy-D-xylulose 5-phosphate reductoisomerase, partial [Pseudomonadota bacterium]